MDSRNFQHFRIKCDFNAISSEKTATSWDRRIRGKNTKNLFIARCYIFSIIICSIYALIFGHLLSTSWTATCFLYSILFASMLGLVTWTFVRRRMWRALRPLTWLTKLSWRKWCELMLPQNFRSISFSKISFSQRKCERKLKFSPKFHRDIRLNFQEIFRLFVQNRLFLQKFSTTHFREIYTILPKFLKRYKEIVNKTIF